MSSHYSKTVTQIKISKVEIYYSNTNTQAEADGNIARATSLEVLVSGLLPSTPLLVWLELPKHLRILAMIIAKMSTKKSESIIATTLLTERDPSLSQKKVYSQQ